MNIRVDLDYPIKDGTEVVFRSPVDCSQVTGLMVYYKENGISASEEFAFADAHGNNVGDIDHLFAENAVVKVILDVTTGMAFVQNADTNAYLEGRFASIEGMIPPGIVNEASGSGITLKDSSNRELQGLTLYGKTFQPYEPLPSEPGIFVNAAEHGWATVEINTYETNNNAQLLDISIPNGLPGVPVHFGGNYTDESGQQWVCDEIDFARGVYVQRVKTITINGGVAWTKSGNGLYSYTYLTDVLPMKSNNITGMSNQIPQQSRAQLSYDYISHVNMDSGIQFRNVVTNFGLSELTSDAFNAYLAENPITIMYPMKSPKETPLDEETLTAYKNANLHTYKPNTTITTDLGGFMAVEYVADTKAYIDNKFTELQNAILSSGANV